MATLTSNARVDFSRTFFGPASIVSATSTQLTVKDPEGHTQIYVGSFSSTYTYSDGYRHWHIDWLTSLSNYAIDGSLTKSITGMSVDGAVWKAYADANDGNGLASYIFRGNDSMSGSSYNDVLWGYEGNDTLNGGAGADTMTGGLGDDTYYVDNVGDVIIEAAGTGSGSDTVNSSASYTLGTNLEKLTLTGSAAISATGNTLNNTLTGNNAANILNGMDGNDTMLGGLGNDTYIVNATGDVVTEGVDQGTDTVRSTVSYALSANVENLTLTGIMAINSIGNILANTLTGNSGNNILSGLAGDDTLLGNNGNDNLSGGLGNDSLTGGAGKDSFLFNSALDANIDRIEDFVAIDDTVRLDQTIFSSLTTLGTLAGTGFFRSSATGMAADTNDYILYNSSNGALFYDADGSSTSAAAVQFATLTSLPTINAADFVVVA